MSASGAKMVQVLEAEQANPIVMVGVRPDGVFRLAINPRVRLVIQKNKTFIDDLTNAIRDGLQKMGYAPLDDLDLR